MKKRRNVKVQLVRDKIEVELTETVNPTEQKDIIKFGMIKIDEAFVSGTSIKTVKRVYHRESNW